MVFHRARATKWDLGKAHLRSKSKFITRFKVSRNRTVLLQVLNKRIIEKGTSTPIFGNFRDHRKSTQGLVNSTQQKMSFALLKEPDGSRQLNGGNQQPPVCHNQRLSKSTVRGRGKSAFVLSPRNQITFFYSHSSATFPRHPGFFLAYV